MPPWFTNERAIYLGWLSGWFTIALFIVSFAAEFIASIRQIELPEQYVSPIQTAMYFILSVGFLLGVRAFAERRQDVNLRKKINTILAIWIAQMILVFPMSLPLIIDEEFMTLLLIAVIPLVCINGIILLQLAEAFSKHVPELGTLGKRIIVWNRIAGWMLASIILIIPGLLPLIVGEFFLWRLLARETRNSSPVIKSTNG